MKSLADISEDLSLFDDWMDKYAYLIDLGRQVPALPEELRVEAHKVKGCTSQVWLVRDWDAGKLHLQGDSDALIVKGLLGLVLAAYDGKTREEVAKLDLVRVFKDLGLSEHLTPNRRSGFASMVAVIRGG